MESKYLMRYNILKVKWVWLIGKLGTELQLQVTLLCLLYVTILSLEVVQIIQQNSVDLSTFICESHYITLWGQNCNERSQSRFLDQNGFININCEFSR